MKIVVAKELMKANDQIAADLRARFDTSGVFAVNLLGSPGSGKTALLEALIPHFRDRARLVVIEGDLHMRPGDPVRMLRSHELPHAPLDSRLLGFGAHRGSCTRGLL